MFPSYGGKCCFPEDLSMAFIHSSLRHALPDIYSLPTPPPSFMRCITDGLDLHVTLLLRHRIASKTLWDGRDNLLNGVVYPR